MKNSKKKSFDYFDTLTTMTGFALKEAALLKGILENFSDSAIEEGRTKIHELEHQCDIVKHELTTALIKDFLPPVDREDLFQLSHRVDNLTDSVENIIVFFYMANITKLREDTDKFTSLIIECCEATVELMKEFRNFKKSDTIKGLIVKLNDIEEVADKLYMESVRRLSKDENADTREVVEWRDVYKIFEECFDAAESIADNIEEIVMKNS